MSEALNLIADARAAALARRFDRAAELATRALDSLPSCLAALRILAWAQLELGDDSALATFESCTAIDPEDALAHVGQAIWHQRRGETEAAIHAWERAWELDPHNQSIRRALVKLTGELPESLLADGIGLMRADRPDEAAEVLRQLGLSDVESSPGRATGALGDLAAEKVIEALVHAGVPVRGFNVVAPDLEELFVSLTGEGFDVSG
jgi:tetratricopeptide (TPR) repeat protein